MNVDAVLEAKLTFPEIDGPKTLIDWRPSVDINLFENSDNEISFNFLILSTSWLTLLLVTHVTLVTILEILIVSLTPINETFTDTCKLLVDEEEKLSTTSLIKFGLIAFKILLSMKYCLGLFAIDSNNDHSEIEVKIFSILEL